MITVTDSALNQIKKLILSRPVKPEGIKLGIETKGCSGLTYKLEYVDTPLSEYEVVKIDDIKIYVDLKSSLFLIGTKMDYQEGIIESGFKFLNPNEKGRCGCGESFHI